MKRNIRKIILDGWKLFCKDINSAKWAIMFIVAYFVVLKKYFYTVCPMVLFTGIPCPACGLTRAGYKVLHLDFFGAFEIHPFIYPILLLIVIFFVERYVLQKKKMTVLKWCAITVIIGMIIFYIWRMVKYFPDVPPMTYYRYNVFNYFKNIMELLL
ncbi:MAG: DUF2752 domain-containing protein [Lachnospiraceae bacterium]